MPFLDTKKQKWVIGKLELPIKENLPMGETKWFREQLKQKGALQVKGMLSDTEVALFENEWDDHVATIILGTTTKALEESGISDAQYREVLAEAYIFLKAFGTLEKAKQSGIYDQTILEPDTKPSQTSQN